AVLMVGNAHPLATSGGPKVIDTRSLLVPNSQHIMGMVLFESGYRNILRPEVPELAGESLPQLIAPLLANHHLPISKIRHWIVHPGGPKVIQAVTKAFNLDDEALSLSRKILARVGNISSPTVLFMLDEILSGERPAPGAYGLMIAMGSGFSQEALLLQW
ncbi:MAG: 3-oxoacyl-[acyl-carrier-protein] synthase III C-terminal domain-containing protein, partial [Acidobacteriota bacterium]